MKFYRRASRRPARVAVFPGSYNPPTVAHLALAEAALAHADEVLFVLPAAFPHKDFSGVSFDGRLALLLAATDHPRYSVASTSGGLFLDIAEELRPHYDARLHFLCGRDAAERIVAWDYGRPDALEQMFAKFSLLVAARQGHYLPPPAYAAAIAPLHLDRDYGDFSATAVRQALLSGGDWQALVPPTIHAQVEQLYGAQTSAP